MELIFATHNQNKAREIQEILGPPFRVKSLAEIGWEEDIPETAPTLKGNALIKARAVYEATKTPCFADDTGLEVDALHGAPGVISARYAGDSKSADDNMDKLLSEMTMADDRRARFRTCMALIISGEAFVFEGIVDGLITQEKRGIGGFGYDPIFLPDGEERTFAEMNAAEKHCISHRARALAKMTHFLKKLI